ncbi:MAG: ATP-binding cassette domain-containing protein [Oscillospiraceae bacterium]|jgi:peptide/nickel transport system ATP-binding protein|nr:ATP-binding cassette domain-containing protein [Oscillospiraceae bacterium]
MRVEAKNIVFGYERGKTILNGVSLSIESGERVALVGLSGCGKSTLSQILAGNLTPRSGDVLLDGRALPRRGFCPVQLIYQHPEKAINPRWKLGRTLTEAWAPDEAFLESMGIEQAWLNRYPAELSGGEMQRFCIARALAPQTRLVIADEMSTMLDVITQAQIWETLLRAAGERGLGLLAVTHNAELAKRVCTRVVEFRSLCRED